MEILYIKKIELTLLLTLSRSNKKSLFISNLIFLNLQLIGSENSIFRTPTNDRLVWLLRFFNVMQLY